MDAAILRAYLHQKGYRLTAPRMAILDAIIRDENKHLSANEIHLIVQKQHPGLGIATVYKNLRMFEQEGLINRFELDNAGHYEINLDDAHCHLLCLKCGSITESEQTLLRHIGDLLEKENGFKLQKRPLVFYGNCDKCSPLPKKKKGRI